MILVCGICVGSASFIFLGFHLTYPTFLVCAALAGLANSVYQPGDYAILTSVGRRAAHGRAFSIHTFAGFLGGAVAPALMLLLVSTFTMRGALIGWPDGVYSGARRAAGAGPAKTNGRKTGRRAVSTSVWTPAILTLTLLFTMISLDARGISQFSIVAFMGGRGISFGDRQHRAHRLSFDERGAGVLVGGYLADRTHRHDLVATINYGLNGVVLLCVAIIPMAPFC